MSDAWEQLAKKQKLILEFDALTPKPSDYKLDTSVVAATEEMKEPQENKS